MTSLPFRGNTNLLSEIDNGVSPEDWMDTVPPCTHASDDVHCVAPNLEMEDGNVTVAFVGRVGFTTIDEELEFADVLALGYEISQLRASILAETNQQF
jgi:hypothetical protein